MSRPVHRFFMGERQNIMQRIYKYSENVGMVLFPKIVKTSHFRGTFEWNKSLINVAKCYADCIAKCVAAYGIVCFSCAVCTNIWSKNIANKVSKENNFSVWTQWKQIYSFYHSFIHLYPGIFNLKIGN